MKFDILYKYFVEGKNEAYELLEAVYIAKGGKGALDIETDPKGVLKTLGKDLDKIKKNPNDSVAANEIFKILEVSGFLKKYTVKTDGKEVTLSANQILKIILEDTRPGGFKPTHRFRDPAKMGKVDKNGKPFYLPADNSHEKIVHLNILDFGKSGGNKALAKLYQKIYTHLGKPWLSYRRREDTPTEREREKDIIYYWGQDGKPYRTALKVDENGKLSGGAFYYSDLMNQKPKGLPLAFTRFDPPEIKNANGGSGMTPAELKKVVRQKEFQRAKQELSKFKSMTPQEQAANPLKYNVNPEAAFRKLYPEDDPANRMLYSLK